jgi:Na+-translocating ferredoxin:NAD+ oxidoreductase RnfG subunit
MYRIIFLLFALLIINTYLAAQTSIDFFPKKLQKELNTTSGIKIFLNEIIPPSNISSQILLGKFYSVTTKPTSIKIKYIYIGRVNTCRTGGCSINSDQVNNKESEFFDYFILYDSACSILKVNIFNYQATHGQEVTAKSWLKQFIGYNGRTKLSVGKNVDAISGATISVEAVAFDIEHKTSLLKQLLDYFKL